MKKLCLFILLGWIAFFTSAGAAQKSQLSRQQPRAAVVPFGADGMQRIVESQHGAPFVLVVWSLDCTYCQASMATLAKLKTANKDFKDLHVVTLLSDGAQGKESAELMYRKLGTLDIADVWAFDSTPPEQLRYAVDPGWHGELPRIYWYRADGSRSAYSGVLTPRAIQSMLVGSRHKPF